VPPGSKILRTLRDTAVDFSQNPREFDGISIAMASASSGGSTMPDLRFIALATDPNLISGVYNGCDQWCDYCPLTARCLAFHCRPRPDARGDIYHDIAESMYASMNYLKDCHEAEGLKLPEDLTRLLEDDPRKRLKYVPVDDPLERMGKHYVMLAAAFLMTRDDVQEEIPKRPDGPTPCEVFLWYHMLIATKIYRAIMSSSQAARTGSAHARWDADMTAKVALLGIDRSHEALQVMSLDDPDPRIEHMRRHLARLRRELEGRFPAARALVRPGFDDGGST
jgi:hypothetical protein